MNAVATEAEITLPRDGAAAQPPRVARSLMRVAVDARGAALAVIAIVAAVFALHWARTFCVSLLLGILLAYTLNPLVVRMQQIRIPRAIAAALAVLALVAVCVLAIEALGGQVNAIAQELPDAATKISARIAKLRNGQPGTIANVQAAAQEIEKATNQVAATPASGRPATRLVVEQPGFNLGSFLLANSIGVAAFAGQAVMVVFLVFFLLSSGDAF